MKSEFSPPPPPPPAQKINEDGDAQMGHRARGFHGHKGNNANADAELAFQESMQRYEANKKMYDYMKQQGTARGCFPPVMPTRPEELPQNMKPTAPGRSR